MRIWKRLPNFQSHDHVIDRLPFNPKTIHQCSYFRESHGQIKRPPRSIVGKHPKIYPSQGFNSASKLDRGCHEPSTQTRSPIATLNADSQFATMLPRFQAVPFQVHVANNIGPIVKRYEPPLPTRFVQRPIQGINIQTIGTIGIIRSKRHEVVIPAP